MNSKNKNIFKINLYNKTINEDRFSLSTNRKGSTTIKYKGSQAIINRLGEFEIKLVHKVSSEALNALVAEWLKSVDKEASINNWMKYYRIYTKKMTQKEFAKSLGLSQGHICKVEKGAEVNFKMLSALRREHRVNVNKLMDQISQNNKH